MQDSWWLFGGKHLPRISWHYLFWLEVCLTLQYISVSKYIRSKYIKWKSVANYISCIVYFLWTGKAAMHTSYFSILVDHHIIKACRKYTKKCINSKILYCLFSVLWKPGYYTPTRAAGGSCPGRRSQSRPGGQQRRSWDTLMFSTEEELLVWDFDNLNRGGAWICCWSCKALKTEWVTNWRRRSGKMAVKSKSSIIFKPSAQSVKAKNRTYIWA